MSLDLTKDKFKARSSYSEITWRQGVPIFRLWKLYNLRSTPWVKVTFTLKRSDKDGNVDHLKYYKFQRMINLPVERFFVLKDLIFPFG